MPTPPPSWPTPWRCGDQLYQETIGRIQETDLTVPWTYRGWAYYTRTEKGKQYADLVPQKRRRAEARRPGRRRRGPARRQPAGDRRKVHERCRFSCPARTGACSPTPPTTPAFATTCCTCATSRPARTWPDRTERVGAVAWASDNQTLLHDHHRPGQARLQAVAPRARRAGRAAPSRGRRPGARGEGRTVQRAGRPRPRRKLDRGRHRQPHHLRDPAAAGRRPRRPAPPGGAPRQADHLYEVEPAGDTLYVRSNEGCRNFRLLSAPLASPGPDSWQELLPCRPEVMLERLSAFRGYVVLGEREDALPQMTVIDRKRRRAPPDRLPRSDLQPDAAAQRRIRHHHGWRSASAPSSPRSPSTNTTW